jgi:hypothetical protein
MPFQQSNSSDVASKAAGKITAKAESQEALKSNRDRLVAVITNPSAKDAWLALGAKAVSEEGIYLKKEGGAFVCDFYTGAISVVGEGNITWAEV